MERVKVKPYSKLKNSKKGSANSFATMVETENLKNVKMAKKTFLKEKNSSREEMVIQAQIQESNDKIDKEYNLKIQKLIEEREKKKEEEKNKIIRDNFPQNELFLDGEDPGDLNLNLLQDVNRESNRNDDYTLLQKQKQQLKKGPKFVRNPQH